MTGVYKRDLVLRFPNNEARRDALLEIWHHTVTLIGESSPKKVRLQAGDEFTSETDDLKASWVEVDGEGLEADGLWTYAWERATLGETANNGASLSVGITFSKHQGTIAEIQIAGYNKALVESTRKAFADIAAPYVV